MKKSGLLCFLIILILLIGGYLYNNYQMKKFELEKNEAITMAVDKAIDSVNQRHALRAPEQITEAHKPVKKEPAPPKKVKEPKLPDNILIDERDGQKYPTKEINGRIWMTANLNYSTNDSWCYSNEEEECDENGRLYTWDAAMKACPDGWKLPDDQDWNTLFDEYGGIHYAGSDLKKGGTSDFNVLFSGYRDKQGFYGKMDESAYFWSATEQSDLYASFKGIYNSVENIGAYTYPKTDAFSVRCVKIQ